MRKSFYSGLSIFLVCLGASCHCRNDVSITISENDEVFKMSSCFNKDKTRRIQRYLDEQIGRENKISFVRNKVDAMLTLKDKTTFYIKSLPGELVIKLNKDQNSEESYEEVKEMCEGIKSVIAHD